MQPSDARATPVLEGVRALVTGGTSGLGFAMSQALDEAGARVALTGRTERRVQEAATQITRDGRVTGLVMDVRDEQSVSAGVDHARAILGGVDVLVNNAGIGIRTVNPDFMTEPRGFWHVSPDGFRDLFATNVLGYFLVARAIVPPVGTASGRSNECGSTGRASVARVPRTRSPESQISRPAAAMELGEP